MIAIRNDCDAIDKLLVEGGACNGEEGACNGED